MLHILLWRRAQEPFRGRWSLPGGPLGEGELLGASIGRQLAEKVDIRHIGHLEQVETRSDPARDPTGRVIATVYLGLVPQGLQPALPDDTAWHPARSLPDMAFDHASMIQSALGRLRAKLSYTNIGFALAPQTFTLAELRDIYVAALGHDIAVTNLQRVLLRRAIIEPTGEVSPPSGRGGGRPAGTYSFTADQLQITDAFAVLKPPTTSSQV